MPDPPYRGLLCIGDPHLASRIPGFRKDDYPRTILAKLRWALSYARDNSLLPLVLGDLFHWPQDNSNWLVVQLLDLFQTPILAIAGNHDCAENALTENDTLSVLTAADHIHLLDTRGPWTGTINGIPTLIGGTPWNQPLPESGPGFRTSTSEPAPFPKPETRDPKPDSALSTLPSALVFWLTHHDLHFPDSEQPARLACQEIPGIDVVINGHIHRRLEDVVCGRTTYLNPGNIARVTRSDSSRARIPSVLRIDIGSGLSPEPGSTELAEVRTLNPELHSLWSKQFIEIPHQPFDAVFHAEVTSADLPVNDSLFIRGLAALESLKTGGAGLRAFLNDNLSQFDEPVAKQILALAEEVLNDADQST